jgi:sulfur carrier protein ThiS
MTEGKPTAKIVFRKQEWEFRAGMTLRDAIRKANLDPQEVLGLRNGKLVTDDTLLQPGETIRLVAVISGG